MLLNSHLSVTYQQPGTPPSLTCTGAGHSPLIPGPPNPKWRLMLRERDGGERGDRWLRLARVSGVLSPLSSHRVSPSHLSGWVPSLWGTTQ